MSTPHSRFRSAPVPGAQMNLRERCVEVLRALRDSQPLKLQSCLQQVSARLLLSDNESIHELFTSIYSPCTYLLPSSMSSPQLVHITLHSYWSASSFCFSHFRVFLHSTSPLSASASLSAPQPSLSARGQFVGTLPCATDMFGPLLTLPLTHLPRSCFANHYLALLRTVGLLEGRGDVQASPDLREYAMKYLQDAPGP